MTTNVQLDETDIKILTILLRDARTKQIDIAKECKTSAMNISKKINRLKQLKVITGSTIFLNSGGIGLSIIATIGINVKGIKENEVFEALEEHACIAEPSKSIGDYDICALIFAKDLSELDRIAYSVKEKFAAKVAISMWSGSPMLAYDNLDLQPLRRQEL